MDVPRRLRVAIDCGIDDPRQGVATAILSLAHALSESGVRDQEYTFIISKLLEEWLRPHIFGPCHLEATTKSQLSHIKDRLAHNATLRATWRAVARPSDVPISSGLVESQNFDLVHFPTQRGYVTSLPTIYQPHDLQHLHYPEFFNRVDVAVREHMYRALCSRARVVCVHTEWSKRDIVEKYGVPPDKIEVIKWGCVLETYEAPSTDDVHAAIRKFDLPDQFFFYPAVTWPHKNHQVVLRALRYLLDHHQRTVKVVFTGAPGSYHGQLNALADDLGVSGQVSHLGFVSEKELQVIYKESTALVFPSKFEGFGLPILEAFRAGTPVLAANATVLPEIAQEAAVYFGADSPKELALAMLGFLDSQSFRQRCIQEGTRVLNQFSFKDTASRFQKLYRRIAGNHWLKPSPRI